MSVAIKVFISHKQVDAAQAKHIADRLLNVHQISSYLDVIDPIIGKTGEALADYVREQLGKCTQLLAVVSPATQESWWVPWEIGVATEKDYPLATFGGSAVLPEFLRKWPVLKNDHHLDLYAQASKLADREYETKRRVLVEASVAQRGATKEFYRTLRGSLGQ